MTFPEMSFFLQIHLLVLFLASKKEEWMITQSAA